MNSFCNKHYITTDAQGRITSGWSDGPRPNRDTANAICINEQGGYQFRLSPGGEENPALRTTDGIPLYKYDDGQIVPRTEEELAADRLPDIKAIMLSALSDACSRAIVAGCDVALSGGSSGHISLTAEDQINLTNAAAAVEGGAEAYPYHLDGQLCALYPAADILTMARAATAHKLYHTTYYNHLAAWVRRCETVADMAPITYGAALPDDLAANMAEIISAAGSGMEGGAGENAEGNVDPELPEQGADAV